MTTKDIGRELKDAREAQKISLEEIAEATRINLDYLNEIETGNFEFLPEPYVVAYIKLFAARVGLQGEALIRKWEDINRARRPVEEPQPVPTDGAAQPGAAHQVPKAEEPAERSYWLEFAIGAGVLIIILLIFYILNQGTPSGEAAKPVLDVPQEIPISEMIRENKARVESLTAHAPPAALVAAGKKPFQLRLQATDTVWVQLISDGIDTSEYLFLPGRRAAWQASEYFILRTGNAGATRLFLSGKDLGVLGPQGGVRKFRITRNGMAPE